MSKTSERSETKGQSVRASQAEMYAFWEHMQSVRYDLQI